MAQGIIKKHNRNERGGFNKKTPPFSLKDVKKGGFF